MAERTKKQLEADLSDARGEVLEVQKFLEKTKSKLLSYEYVLQGILDIHKPYVDNSRLLPADGFMPTVTLRCMVCDTSEHHTWGNDNDEMWPCPTLQLFVKTRESPIVVSE